MSTKLSPLKSPGITMFTITTQQGRPPVAMLATPAWLGAASSVVAARSSTVNAKRGVGPSSAGRASDGLPRAERLAGSGLGAALVGAANAGKLMLARSSRLSAAEGRRRDGNPRIITLPFSRAL